jgi:hypothetical protein
MVEGVDLSIRVIFASLFTAGSSVSALLAHTATTALLLAATAFQLATELLLAAGIGIAIL